MFRIYDATTGRPDPTLAKWQTLIFAALRNQIVNFRRPAPRLALRLNLTKKLEFQGLNLENYLTLNLAILKSRILKMQEFNPPSHSQFPGLKIQGKTKLDLEPPILFLGGGRGVPNASGKVSARDCLHEKIGKLIFRFEGRGKHNKAFQDIGPWRP